MKTFPSPLAVVVNAKSHPAANTAAVVTLAADAQGMHVIDHMTYSYEGGATTDETLTVTIGGVTKYAQYINASKNQEIPLPGGLYNQALTKNEEVIATLSASGAGATGKLNVVYRTLRQLPEPSSSGLFHHQTGAAGVTPSTAVPHAAQAGTTWVVDWIHCSYGGAPAGGNLVVAFDGTTEWKVDLPAVGDHYFDFAGGIYGAVGVKAAVSMAPAAAIKSMTVKYR